MFFYSDPFLDSLPWSPLSPEAPRRYVKGSEMPGHSRPRWG